MGRKSKFSKEQKIEICRRYLDGSESVISLAKEINAGKNTVKKWIRIFKAYGVERHFKYKLILQII